MQLKRYRSASVREALAQARVELGPDALVLATRLVSVRGVRGWMGKREVELTAGHRAGMSDSRPAERRPDIPAPAATGDAATPMTGHREEALLARICATGVPREWAERMVDDLPRSQRRHTSAAAIERVAAKQLQDLVAPDEAYAPVELFIGPPGVGKTTTIAKIAAQERARRGARLNLLAADGFRVGAVEQLRLYADIIGSPFFTARTAGEIEQSILAARGPVLVDTAGRSPKDVDAQEAVSMLSGLPGVRTHLVMPAASTRRDMERMLDGLSTARPDRIVLTRVDEADSLSPVMRVLEERRLPVSYLGTGQRVPDDLERATATGLAACVMGLGQPMERRA